MAKKACARKGKQENAKSNKVSLSLSLPTAARGCRQSCSWLISLEAAGALQTIRLSMLWSSNNKKHLQQPKASRVVALRRSAELSRRA